MRSNWMRRDYEIEGDDGELKVVSVEVQCEMWAGSRDEAPMSEIDWRRPKPRLTAGEESKLETVIYADESLFDDAFEPDYDRMNDAKDDR